jgi:hypothetical protein
MINKCEFGPQSGKAWEPLDQNSQFQELGGTRKNVCKADRSIHRDKTQRENT